MAVFGAVKRWARQLLGREDRDYLSGQIDNAIRDSLGVAERAQEVAKQNTKDATAMRSVHAEIWRTKDRMDRLVQQMKRG